MRKTLGEKKRYERFDFNSGILVFDRKVQGEEFLDWLNTMDEIFEYCGTLEHRKDKTCCR